jgi:hypothetical protein
MLCYMDYTISWLMFARIEIPLLLQAETSVWR